jgi:predicted lipid-binding transport protein (Tim44 family)
MKRANLVAMISVLTLSLAAASWAAHPYVYPAKGQTTEQQQKDQYECHEWAVQQTGFDPSQPVEQSMPRSGLLGGAARGAALGAVGGAIGGDAGKGAAIGAAVGGLATVMRDRRANEAQQQAYSSASASYDRAYGACLRGRGYTVN